MPVVSAISPIEELLQTIVAKAVKEAASEIPVGSYDLSGSKVLIEFKEGSKAVKGEDEKYIPTTSISLIAVMAVFAKQAGIHQERLLSVLHEAVSAAVIMEDQTKEYIAAFEKDYAAAEKKVRETLEELPKKTRSGKLLTKEVRTEMKFIPGPALSSLAAKMPVTTASVTV